ncbi:hypothetical protein ES703_93667 [subsurface metagenome]
MIIKTDTANIYGKKIPAQKKHYSDQIAFNDHKIKFVIKYCRNKSVLDLGCVMHDPENYKSKYWVHKAIREVAADLIGLDLYQEGVDYLRERGFNVVFGDAQNFQLDKKFNVIVAGDIVEHLEDHHGFIESCKRHMHRDSRLLISTPNPWFWKRIVRSAFQLEQPNSLEHTCWFCTRTLRQLVNRHGMDVGEIVFGSRSWKDRIIPLPTGWRHNSFHAEVFIRNVS